METIQLAISNRSYAAALRDLLARNPGWRIVVADAPDPAMEGVMVVDSESLERLPQHIARPERIVLITQKDAPHLARAWEAGIVSVVYDNEPINTALLAIMAARLRVAKGPRAEGGIAAGSGTNHVNVDQNAQKRRGEP